MTNMAEPVYFLNLEIENYRCFKDKQVLDLSDGKGNWKKWTLILGENGMGKSSVLELMAALEMEGLREEDGSVFYSPRGVPFGPAPRLQMKDVMQGTCKL